jgi:hypothetical protein
MNHKKVLKTHIDRKLLFRAIMFFAMFMVMTAFVIYDIVQNPQSLALAMMGYCGGIVIGLIVSRMFKIFWHEEQSKVMSKFDEVGIVILAGYIIFALGRNFFLGYFFAGQILIIFSFSILAGIMFGRFAGLRSGIIKTLKKNGKI